MPRGGSRGFFCPPLAGVPVGRGWIFLTLAVIMDIQEIIDQVGFMGRDPIQPPDISEKFLEDINPDLSLHKNIFHSQQELVKDTVKSVLRDLLKRPVTSKDLEHCKLLQVDIGTHGTTTELIFEGVPLGSIYSRWEGHTFKCGFTPALPYDGILQQ